MAITNDEWRKLGKLLDDKLEEKLEQKLTEKLADTEHNILTSVTNYIDERIIPMIEEKANRVDTDRMERKLDRALEKLDRHDKRISGIESVPAVAHQLSIKKPRKSA